MKGAESESSILYIFEEYSKLLILCVHERFIKIRIRNGKE